MVVRDCFADEVEYVIWEINRHSVRRILLPSGLCHVGDG